MRSDCDVCRIAMNASHFKDSCTLGSTCEAQLLMSLTRNGKVFRSDRVIPEFASKD
jgi:hypothetical protein